MIRAKRRTGSAGLINLIKSFSGGHLAAGILCIVATVGWTLQGLGHAFYYRQVRLAPPFHPFVFLTLVLASV